MDPKQKVTRVGWGNPYGLCTGCICFVRIYYKVQVRVTSNIKLCKSMQEHSNVCVSPLNLNKITQICQLQNTIFYNFFKCFTQISHTGEIWILSAVSSMNTKKQNSKRTETCKKCKQKELNKKIKNILCVICLVSCVMCHVSSVTSHFSCVTCHTSPFPCPLSPFTCHLAPVNNNNSRSNRPSPW